MFRCCIAIFALHAPGRPKPWAAPFFFMRQLKKTGETWPAVVFGSGLAIAMSRFPHGSNSYRHFVVVLCCFVVWEWVGARFRL